MSRCVMFIVIIFVSFLRVSDASAFIYISEILADPKSGIEGDANNDGVTSSSSDEFIEIINDGSIDVDISGWSISDSVKIRHIFEESVIFPAKSFITVFGGGAPNSLNGKIFTSSTGSLSLNNSGDSLLLLDDIGKVIDQYTYGSEGGRDQSLTRVSLSDNFILHGLIAESNGALFSPGKFPDGGIFDKIPPISNSTVPEPSSMAMFLQAATCMLLPKFKRILVG